ncbi:DNA-binding response regulator [Nakamurella silvestris]|nr:DNA-binding response regulator [Nakamurella silvestris]
MTTVLIADDHAAIRAGLRMMIEGTDDLQVVGEAGDGAVAVQQARVLHPDVVLMDIRMPGTDGIAATEQIVGAGLARVLILTTFEIDEYVFGALRAGAAGFLLKSASSAELTEAIRRVAAGDGVLAPEVTRTLIDAFAAGGSPASEPLPDTGSLTARERDVLDRLGEGLSNSQIATALYISETTVKTHVSRVLSKLQLQSRVQAAILAQRLRG